MSIEIVTYKNQHFEGVNELWCEAFPNDAPRNTAKAAIPVKLSVQPDLLLVGVEGERVIGSVLAGFDGYRGWPNRVAVLRFYRQRGIGTMLVREAENRLNSLGCNKINIQINGLNVAVAVFYQRLSYSIEDRISMGKNTKISRDQQ